MSLEAPSETFSADGNDPAPSLPSFDASESLPSRAIGFAWYWGVPNHVIPFLGFIAAIALAFRNGMPLEIHLATLFMGAATGLAVTLGFHRLFVHHSFKTHAPVAWLLAILGCMAGQASLLFWVCVHRQHHRHSDRLGDPHSPRLFGLWFSHAGWQIHHRYTYDPREVRDLLRRTDLVWIDRYAFFWYLLGLLLPALACGAALGTWEGALMGFLWGGLYRHFVVQHLTYLVNSMGHVWGTQDHATGDGSRNSLLVGTLAGGEGWHNNHHAFPYSARHGLLWWQVDATWYVIWVMSRLGLAWDVRLPKGPGRGH